MPHGRLPYRCHQPFALAEAGLDPIDKAERCAWYWPPCEHEMLSVAHACGVVHPSLVVPDMLELLEGNLGSVAVTELFDYHADWGLPSPADREQIVALMAELDRRHVAAPGLAPQ